MRGVNTRVAAVAASLGLLAVQAHAALPTAVTDAIDDATADITTAGGLLIGLAALGLGLRWIKGMFF